MSSIPVQTTGHSSIYDAIQDALNNDTVFNDLKTLTSFKATNFGLNPQTDPHGHFTPTATWTGSEFIGDTVVGGDNLLLTDANSTVNIGLGDRSSNSDPRAVVVVGGNSSITFQSDAATQAFGFDVVSGAGTNTISLNAGNDLFQSTAGNDSVTSGGGVDTLIGGTGHDTLVGGGSSLIKAGSAGDSITSSSLASGHDTIQAGTGSDTITLEAGNNSVIGSTGSTFIQGGSGNDSVSLGAKGNDSIFGQSGHDVNVKIAENAPSPSDVSTVNGVTTITFSPSQTLVVQHVKITFTGGSSQSF